MAHIDMTRPDREFKPGIDIWVVKTADEKQSSNGNNMFSIRFVRESDPSDSLFDNIMLESRGWPIGKRRLQALGVAPDHSGELHANALVGKRVFLATHVTNYRGEDRLQVDRDGLTHAGYQPISNPPDGYGCTQEDRDATADGDDPF